MARLDTTRQIFGLMSAKRAFDGHIIWVLTSVCGDHDMAGLPALCDNIAQGPINTYRLAMWPTIPTPVRLTLGAFRYNANHNRTHTRRVVSGRPGSRELVLTGATQAFSLPNTHLASANADCSLRSGPSHQLFMGANCDGYYPIFDALSIPTPRPRRVGNPRRL